MALSEESIIAITCGSVVGLIVIVSLIVYFSRKSSNTEGSRLLQDPENPIETPVDQNTINYNTFQNSSAGSQAPLESVVTLDQTTTDPKLSSHTNQSANNTPLVSESIYRSAPQNEQSNQEPSHFTQQNNLSDSQGDSGRSSPDLHEPKTPEPIPAEVSAQETYKDKLLLKREKSTNRKKIKKGAKLSTRSKKKGKNNLF